MMENAMHGKFNQLVYPDLVNQRRIDVDRLEAEFILQNLYGPIKGVERLDDQAIQERIPTQYRLVQPRMDTNAKIHNLLYEALEAIDSPLDLLQIVGSLGDTQPFSETIKQLQAFIEREKAR